jgi:ADP-ribose pyrophosphatase YjhB (NUDIX family)
MMKFCSECGSKVVFEPRSRGATSRFVCTACQTVFYQSPKLATGCIAERDTRIVLCRRAVPPNAGLWELPAGFVASGEAVQSAAMREVLEEANVEVEIQRVYALLHIPHINQMRVIYLARLLDDKLRPGAETAEARLFDEAQVPWNDLAFATTRDVLQRYFRDRKTGEMGFFFADIVPFDGWSGTP